MTETAKYLKFDFSTLKQMIDHGLFIDGVKIGKRVYYPLNDLNFWRACGCPPAEEFRLLKHERNMNLARAGA